MKQNLSTSSVTSTYAGEFAGNYIQAMLLANTTLGNGTITIKPNIKYKQVVKKLATSGVVKGATCDFTNAGNVTLTERIIEPKQLQINLQLCKSDFEQDWEAVEMGFSAFDVLPKNFSDFLIANLSGTVGGETEKDIWQGTGAADSFSGFTTLFKADSTVLDVTLGSGVTIDASNVQNALAAVVTKVASTNVYLSGVKPVIYAATDIIASYLISLGGFGANGLGGNGYKGEGPAGSGNAPLFYAGLEIVEAPGLPVGEMVAAQKENLWFGTGLLNDTNTVQVLDMAQLDGSKNVRFIARYTASVQYGIGSEIVYFWKY